MTKIIEEMIRTEEIISSYEEELRKTKSEYKKQIIKENILKYQGILIGLDRAVKLFK